MDAVGIANDGFYDDPNSPESRRNIDRMLNNAQRSLSHSSSTFRHRRKITGTPNERRLSQAETLIEETNLVRKQKLFLHNKSLVKLNLSGTVFLVKQETLASNTILFEKFLIDSIYLPDTKEYYLERDPYIFRYILSYIRHGELHLPEDVCGPLLEKELDLWGISLGLDIQRCCIGRVTESRWKMEVLEKFEDFFQPQNYVPRMLIKSESWQIFRDFVWNVVNMTPQLTCMDAMSDSNDNDSDGNLDNVNPLEEVEMTKWNNPRIRKSITIVYVLYQLLIIFLALLVFVLSSVEEFQYTTQYAFLVDKNITHNNKEVPLYHTYSLESGSYLGNSEWLRVIDYLTSFLMTVDIIVRIFFCPNFKPLISMYTVFDVVSIIPFWIELLIVLPITSKAIENSDPTSLIVAGEIKDILNFLRLSYVLRVLRILRRYAPTRVLFYSIRKARSDMALLVLLFFLITVFFGAAVHFADPNVSNIPHGIWFALITFTTVGYGDVSPTTYLGSIFTSVLIICGVLLSAYVIPIVVSNFELFYNHVNQLKYLTNLQAMANKKQLQRYLKLLSYRLEKRRRNLMPVITGSVTDGLDNNSEQENPYTEKDSSETEINDGGED